MTEPRRDRRLAALATLLLVALGGCALLRKSTSPWDAYADRGRVRVYGMPAGAAGPRLFAALVRRPELAELREPEPDALEVVGARGGARRIVLLYWRRGVGRPHRVVVTATPAGTVMASAAEPLRRNRRAVTVRSEGGVGGERADTGDEREADAACPDCDESPRRPNATQALECPIDRARPDCRALCAPGTTYEWCQ